MRYMIIVKATADSEAGLPPSEALMAEMAAYHAELMRAGVLLDGAGLKPSAQGWRIRHGAGEPQITDGPFAETKEQLLGFYLIECADLDQAIEAANELARANPGGAYEIRPVERFHPDTRPGVAAAGGEPGSTPGTGGAA